jgi:cellulose synthase/poly-beta-1,6-N-acetylglucosamine synthase-like glycosyltransferase
MTTVLEWLQTAALFYFLIMNGHQLVFLFRAFLAMRRYLAKVEADQVDSLFGTAHYKPISVICPVYNEASGVVDSVSSLLALRYPERQVIVVNDGSTDATLELLLKAFKLKPSNRVVRQVLDSQPVRGIYESLFVPNLVVVDKENGGKADALNCGLNLVRFPLVACMDGDSLLENDTLLRVSRPFLDSPHIIGCAGVIRPLNGCKVTPQGIRGINLPKSWLARFQIVEYLRAFLYGRMGLASYNMLFIVSGALGVYRRDVLLEAGGFSPGTIGEDFEAVVRLHRVQRDKKATYAFAMVPDPICWTEVPEDFRTLGRQRNRWQRGLLETLWAHKRMVGNPRYGSLGLVSLPYFLFFEALAPVVELTGYLILAYYFWTGQLNSPYVLLFLVVAVALGILNSVAAVLLEVGGKYRYQGLRSFLVLMAAAVLENLGYRQLTLWWRLRGTFDFLRGKRGWGRMKRLGAGKVQPSHAD